MTGGGEPIPRVVVSAVVRDGGGRLLLVRRRDDGSWCCPGGHIDFGETLLEALHREVEEEAGVRIEVDRLVGVYSVFGAKAPLPGKHYLAISFACRHAGGEPRPGADELEARWFRDDEVATLALRSNHLERIRDAAADGPVVVA